jgi:membrane associated rhomboid family serine protease
LSDIQPAELLCLALMAAIFAATAWRKRNFVLFATLGMFAITGVEFIARPAGACTLPGIAWQFGYFDEPAQYYKLFTSLFLHDACGAGHIVGNAFTFVLLGWPLEEKIGWKLTMAVFVITGVLGTLVSTTLVVAYGQPQWLTVPVIGASGGIFGVIGYFATRYPHEKVLAPILVILARVPVAIAAVAALAIQALILMQVQNPFIGQPLPWPSIAAHVTSFGIGMLVTRVPWLRAPDTPSERTFVLDLTPLRDLAQRPADKTEVEAIIAEDIPEVAQVKLESFIKRAHCPRCQGPLALKGRKLESDCGWAVSFEKRAAPRRG